MGSGRSASDGPAVNQTQIGESGPGPGFRSSSGSNSVRLTKIKNKKHHVEHEVYCISEALLNNMNVACSQCGKRDGLPHNSLQSDSYVFPKWTPTTMVV